MSQIERELVSDDAMSELFSILSKFGVSDKQEFDNIKPFCRMSHVAKNEFLYRAGEIATDVFFIRRGLARLFYITDDGRELNKSFRSESQFVGASHSFDHLQPSRYFIQALEPCDLIAVSVAGLNQLYEQSLVWANLGRRYMEQLAAQKAKREAEFLLDSAELRYQTFMDENPQLANRLALYHIASYLGITDVALSRIRKRIANKE